jgi:hypothetical protein
MPAAGLEEIVRQTAFCDCGLAHAVQRDNDPISVRATAIVGLGACGFKASLNSDSSLCSSCVRFFFLDGIALLASAYLCDGLKRRCGILAFWLERV